MNACLWYVQMKAIWVAFVPQYCEGTAPQRNTPRRVSMKRDKNHLWIWYTFCFLFFFWLGHRSARVYIQYRWWWQICYVLCESNALLRWLICSHVRGRGNCRKSTFIIKPSTHKWYYILVIGIFRDIDGGHNSHWHINNAKHVALILIS